MTLLSDRAADITRLPAEQPPVMSFAQERLWFMEQIWPDTDAYVLWDTARLRGPLRTDVLAAALRDVVARHDTLRHPEKRRLWQGFSASRQQADRAARG